MLGTFPKAFHREATSQGIFPSGNFSNVQLPKSVLAAVLNPYHVLTTALAPKAHPRRSTRPKMAACGASEGLTQPWWSCRLGKYLWENTYIQHYTRVFTVLTGPSVTRTLLCSPGYRNFKALVYNYKVRIYHFIFLRLYFFKALWICFGIQPVI